MSMQKALAQFYPERDENDRIIFALKSTRRNNPIPLQQSYRGPLCLPSWVADRSCSTLGVECILDDLNATLGVVLDFDTSPGLRDVLEDCVSKGFDFGMAYGSLRQWWKPEVNMQALLSELESLEDFDIALRREAISDGKLTKHWLYPRRLWDLYSNRVLPLWANLGPKTETGPPHEIGLRQPHRMSTVSHAWVDDAERQTVLTPINGGKWPVPIPCGVHLDDIRIELLNAGASFQWKPEYVWLDVLCLRQEGGIEEHERAKEWETDVPLIGTTYSLSLLTYCYLNGLGRIFRSTDLEDKRHWCNRVWTWQEQFGGGPWCLLGRSLESPKLDFKPEGRPLRTVDQTARSPFEKALSERLDISDEDALFPRVAEVTRRNAVNNLDRVAGLFYKTCEPKAAWPLYRRDQPAEDVWCEFLPSLFILLRNDLFFLFPEGGLGRFKWAPSWSQVTSTAHDLAKRSETRSAELWFPDIKQDGEYYSCSTIVLTQYLVEGLDASGPEPRYGHITCMEDKSRSFEVVAYHQHPIPNGVHVLVGTLGLSEDVCRYWVVGSLDDSGQRFTKQSTLQVKDNERRRLGKHLHLNVEEPFLNYAGTIYVETARSTSPEYVRDLVLI